MYSYAVERPFCFTEEGQLKLLAVRDKAFELLRQGGAVEASVLLGAAGSGESWQHMVVVDRLVEIGELREIPNPFSSAWQHRVFVRGNRK